MLASKLTSKYQASIPKDIRERLGLRKGDSIVFEIIDNHVELRKASPIDWAYTESLESTLEEWNSPEDDEAFRDL